MGNLFKYGKLSSKSIIGKNRGPKKKYEDYKSEIIGNIRRHIELIEDPGKRITEGERKDHPYILDISRVAEDFSLIELTLRCGRKLFDFGDKNEKYFRFTVPIESRSPAPVQKIRIQLLNELLERVEADEYKAQIKAYIRRQEKEGFDRKESGWFCY